MNTSKGTSTRHHEAAILRDILQLELSTWGLYRCLADTAATAANRREAITLGSDHRQHIIALRTRLALLGATSPRLPPPRRLQLWGLLLLGWMGSNRRIVDALIRAEGQLRQACLTLPTDVLGPGSRSLVQRILADTVAHTTQVARLATAAERLDNVAVLDDAGDYKVTSKHWVFARL